MECLHFTHELSCEAQHVERAAYLMLHTICFHRMLGTIKPAYIDGFGLTVPAVADKEVDTLIRARSTQIASQCNAIPRPEKLELVISFHHPSKALKNDAQTAGKDDQGVEVKGSAAAGLSAGEKASGMASTAAHAASSLRAWASPKNYQYGWLAQAFSVGAGQPAGTFIPTTPNAAATETSTQGEDAENAFERWTVAFVLPPTKEQGSGSVKDELEEFIDAVLEFVGNNKAHLPAMTSTEVRSYPVTIVSRAVA